VEKLPKLACSIWSSNYMRDDKIPSIAGTKTHRQPEWHTNSPAKAGPPCVGVEWIIAGEGHCASWTGIIEHWRKVGATVFPIPIYGTSTSVRKIAHNEFIVEGHETGPECRRRSFQCDPL